MCACVVDVCGCDVPGREQIIGRDAMSSDITAVLLLSGSHCSFFAQLCHWLGGT